MIYFVRYDDDARPIETASAESGEAAERLKARGFALTGHAAWRAARAELDVETMERMGWKPQARTVGEPLLKTTWMV
jgi:hypothetical protein